jgi:AraC family transcriptional regulator
MTIAVDIVTFPETRVAVVEHRGPPTLEHATARRLIAWKLEHTLLNQEQYRNYGLHYSSAMPAAAADHRVDFCLSFDGEIAPNVHGVIAGAIPRLRCARARDIGSRYDNQAARWLQHTWLPASGEVAADFPVIFHYVNVGPGVLPADMITDVYLPIVG